MPDIRYPVYTDNLQVGRYEIKGTFEGAIDPASVTQSIIPEAHLIDGKEVILESFFINPERGIYSAKINIQENFIPLALLVTSLVGGSIFLNQATGTIDKISKLAILSVPLVVSVITLLIILKK